VSEPLRLTLPLPPRELHPNARPHWAKKARAVRDYRRLAWAYARDAVHPNPPRWKEAETRVVFYFATHRTRDGDGAAAALKAAWDGIADAGVVENDAGLVHYPPTLRVDRDRPRVELELRKVA
jgi:crossover junction endodeoxyribonuclease RusA